LLAIAALSGQLAHRSRGGGGRPRTDPEPVREHRFAAPSWQPSY